MLKNNILKYLGLASLALSLQAQEIYTVDDLIMKSLEKSPNIKVSKLQYDASQSRYDAAFSGYLPEVNFHGSAGRISQDGTFNQEGVEDNMLVGQLSLKQIIYDFGKTGGTSDTQKFIAESYSMDNLQNISNKRRDVKKAYYEVLKASALIDVQKENVKLNKAQLYRSQKYFEAGIRTKIDVSDAEVKLIQAKLNLKTVEYDLKAAYADLDRVVGFTTLEQEYNVFIETLQLDSLYESLYRYKLSLRESILFAYEHRYELKSQQALIKSSQSDIRSVSSEYYPSFYLSADYLYQNAQTDALQLYIPKMQWNANLNLDWNLYAGGYTSSRKQEKVINTSISNSNLLDTKLIIKKSTTNAYINVNRTKDTVELAQSLVKVSNEKFNQASKRYENGLSDYIEIQEARQDYIDSKATLVIDYYDYYTAIADLDNAIGK